MRISVFVLFVLSFFALATPAAAQDVNLTPVPVRTDVEYPVDCPRSLGCAVKLAGYDYRLSAFALREAKGVYRLIKAEEIPTLADKVIYIPVWALHSSVDDLNSAYLKLIADEHEARGLDVQQAQIKPVKAEPVQAEQALTENSADDDNQDDNQLEEVNGVITNSDCESVALASTQVCVPLPLAAPVQTIKDIPMGEFLEAFGFISEASGPLTRYEVNKPAVIYGSCSVLCFFTALIFYSRPTPAYPKIPPKIPPARTLVLPCRASRGTSLVSFASALDNRADKCRHTYRFRDNRKHSLAPRPRA